MNMGIGLVCHPDILISPQGGETPELGFLDCWFGRKGSTLVKMIPKFLLQSVADTLIPLGYQEDNHLGIKKVRGGLQIILNYLVVNIGLLLGVSTAILHIMPSTIVGLEMNKMEMTVEIPETGLRVKSWSGAHIKVKIQVLR